MAQIPKKVVLNKYGQKIRLSDFALAIAKAHFGVTDFAPRTKEVPLELLKLPKKLEIIKAVEKPTEKTVEKSVELPKEEGPTVTEVKKRGRKKNEGTDKSKE